MSEGNVKGHSTGLYMAGSLHPYSVKHQTAVIIVLAFINSGEISLRAPGNYGEAPKRILKICSRRPLKKDWKIYWNLLENLLEELRKALRISPSLGLVPRLVTFGRLFVSPERASI